MSFVVYKAHWSLFLAQASGLHLIQLVKATACVFQINWYSGGHQIWHVEKAKAGGL